jgi:hypothetical protein
LYNGDGPGSISNPNEDWWRYLDEYIEKCKQHSLYVGITLGWWGKLKSSSQTDLYNYGKWVGNRYKNNNNVVWLTLGEAGSHLRKSELPKEKLRALVDGIRDGDTGNKLLTVHADYKRGTSLTSDTKLCDFNNWQTSQWKNPSDLPKKDKRNWTVWEAIDYDYRQGYNGNPKPTLDAEAMYENNKDFCGATPFEIRRRAYFTIFAGAFGHTYGAGGIWDGLISEKGCSKSALEAINYIGAKNIGYLSNFLHKLGNDFLKLQPRQSIILNGNSRSYDKHIQATVAKDNSLALIYSASDAEYTLDLTQLSKNKLIASWYNPRTNSFEKENQRLKKNKTRQKFDPPGQKGPGNDWVLILRSK